MNRTKLRTALTLAGALLVTAAVAGETVSVFKTSGCGCCLAWVKYLEKAGYAVTAKNLAMGDLMQMKLKAGFKVDQTSCHTAKIAGYVVEGHVSVREIERLLRERPHAVGLTVPGMPLGSPGMEVGGDREAYNVLLLRPDGTTEVFASYLKAS